MPARALTRCAAAALLLLLVTLVSSARAQNSFNVGASEADGQKATAQQNKNKDHATDIECGTGYYAWQVWISGAKWGTYPSISEVGISCRTPAGNSAGSDSFGYITFGGTGAKYGSCSRGDRPALTGLRVADDRYIKDFTKRCGRILVSSDDAFVENDGVMGGWLLDRAQNDDDKTVLKCNGDRVVTGLRLEYRQDANEYAVTSVRLLCGRITLRSTEPTSRPTTTTTSTTPKKPPRPPRPGKPPRRP